MVDEVLSEADRKVLARAGIGPSNGLDAVAGIVRAHTFDALEGALHPEFGTAWREPDGVIWKATHNLQEQVEVARSLTEVAEGQRNEARRELRELREGVERVRDNMLTESNGSCTGLGCPGCNAARLEALLADG